MRFSALFLASACLAAACTDPEDPPPDEPAGGASTGGSAPAGGTGGTGGTAPSGGSGGASDDWLDVDWPTTSVDAVTAGQWMFDESLQYRWDLTLGPEDVSCPATDCPGGAPDPLLGAEFEVYGYAGFVDLGESIGSRYPLRNVVAQKSSASTQGGPGVGRGVGPWFFRRAADDALVILTESELVVDGEFTSREDFGTFVVQHDATGTRLVSYPPPFLPNSPLSQDERDALELYFFFASNGTLTFRTGGESIHSMGFAFQASEQSPTPKLDDSAIAAELADPATTETRALEIIAELTEPFLNHEGAMVALEHIAHHPAEEVRGAALAYVEQCYLDPNFTLFRRYMDDRMMAQLLYDPSPALRLAAVATQSNIREQWNPDDYHCSVDQALELCAANDSDAEVAADCNELLTTIGPAYGQCPLPWPE